MRYALLIYQAEVELDPDGMAERAAVYNAYTADIEGRGVYVDALRLRQTASATTVRVRGGDLVVADGPFAETKEQIAGFFLVDCKDLDEALEVAAKIPAAQWGTIEVRPVWDG